MFKILGGFLGDNTLRLQFTVCSGSCFSFFSGLFQKLFVVVVRLNRAVIMEIAPFATCCALRTDGRFSRQVCDDVRRKQVVSAAKFTHAYALSSSSFARGSLKLKSEPLPMLLTTSVLVLWFSRMCFTIAKPNPVPPFSRLRLLSTR